jgi:imidazole glycerol-phosphate synthase subunit HisH
VRVTIFDYGAGNLHSLAKAIGPAASELKIEEDPIEAVNTDVLLLPGVGAFGSAAERIRPGLVEMREALLSGLHCLGICLGMQLLMDASEEGEGTGLGVIAGDVTRLRATRVPQIGWNDVAAEADPIFDDAPISIAYFANSFVCRPADESRVIAWSIHENHRFPAAVRRGNVVGVQFHPEKSSAAGVAFIRSFIEQARP